MSVHVSVDELATAVLGSIAFAILTWLWTKLSSSGKKFLDSLGTVTTVDASNRPVKLRGIKAVFYTAIFALALTVGTLVALVTQPRARVESFPDQQGKFFESAIPTQVVTTKLAPEDEFDECTISSYTLSAKNPGGQCKVEKQEGYWVNIVSGSHEGVP